MELNARVRSSSSTVDLRKFVTFVPVASMAAAAATTSMTLNEGTASARRLGFSAAILLQVLGNSTFFLIFFLWRSHLRWATTRSEKIPPFGNFHEQASHNKFPSRSSERGSDGIFVMTCRAVTPDVRGAFGATEVMAKPVPVCVSAWRRRPTSAWLFFFWSTKSAAFFWCSAAEPAPS